MINFFSNLSLSLIEKLGKKLENSLLNSLENNHDIIKILRSANLAIPKDNFENLYFHSLIIFSTEIDSIEFIELFKSNTVVKAFISERKTGESLFVRELNSVLHTHPAIREYPFLKSHNQVPEKYVQRFHAIFDELLSEIKSPKEAEWNRKIDKQSDVLIDIQTKINKKTAGDYRTVIDSYNSLVLACNNQVDWEFKSFIGSSYDESFYVKRDFDRKMARLINPWLVDNIQRKKYVGLSEFFPLVFDEIYELLKLNNYLKLSNSLNAFRLILIDLDCFSFFKNRINKIIKALQSGVNSDEGKQSIENEIRLLSGSKVYTQPNPLEADFYQAVYEKSESKLKVILKEYESQSINLQGLALLTGTSAEIYTRKYFAFKRVYESFEPFAKEAKSIINTNKSKQIILTADGGKGKTYSLCNTIKKLCSSTPIIFISSKNCYVDFNQDIFKNSIDIMSRANNFKSPGKELFEYIKTYLKNDEQLTIVFDGLDFRTDINSIKKWLRRIRVEIDKMPVRVILSTRREYWPQIKSVYEDETNYLLFSKEINDFSDDEFAKLRDCFDDHNKKPDFSGFYDKRLLRNPSVIGVLIESLTFIPPDSKLLVSDVYESYLRSIISKVNAKVQTNEWFCEMFIEAYFDLIVKSIVSKKYEYTGTIIRKDLIKYCNDTFGEYYPEVINEFENYGLLSFHKTKIWFKSEVLFDYLLAKQIVHKYLNNNILNQSFFNIFDLRKDWLSNKVGVYLFISVILTKNNYKIWEYIKYPFAGETEYYNQLIYYLPTTHISPKIIRKQFSLNINYLKGLQQKWETKLLDNKEKYSQLVYKTSIESNIIAFISDIDKSLLNLEINNEEREYQEESKQNLENEAIYWLKTFGEKIVPLLGILDVPKQTRLLLVDGIAAFLTTQSIPVELSLRVYLEYLNSADIYNIKLDENEKSTVLFSDDSHLCIKFLQACAKMEFREYKHQQYLNVFFEEDTKKTLWYLENKRISAFATDIKKPIINGLDLVRRARTIYGVDIKIAILSAYTMPGDAEKGLDAGADVYFPKPNKRSDIKAIFCYLCSDHIHMSALRDNFYNVLKEKKSLQQN